MRRYVFARHAESAANLDHALNTDPARPLAVTTNFLRTQQTAELALQGRDVPILIEPDLDEIRAGAFDGKPINAYWAWKERHSPRDRFPGGESLDQAIRRYAAAL